MQMATTLKSWPADSESSLRTVSRGAANFAATARAGDAWSSTSAGGGCAEGREAGGGCAEATLLSAKRATSQSKHIFSGNLQRRHIVKGIPIAAYIQVHARHTEAHTT